MGNALIRDGVRLAYDDTGAGNPPIVFVHGWTCRRSDFAAQVARFSPSHRCVAVDLRGHGDSDAPQQDYTIAGFADDVAWTCDRLGVRDAVLVGHSMGGAVVLQLAAARPDLARAVALLDPAIFFPPEMRPLIEQLAEAFAGPDGMEAVRAFEMQQFFIESSAEELKRSIVGAACRTPQHVVVSAFRHLAAFDAEAALTAVKAPLLCVGAEPNMRDEARLRALRPDAIIARTAGAGHFHQVEVPDQVNAMLTRFMEIAG
jgi:pimeloyl-ACP methyl ester carboxylesterase